MMNSYALSDFLQHHAVREEVTVTFEDLQDPRKGGIELPPVAKMSREWWENEAKRRWRDAGWEVLRVNLLAHYVTFRRATSD